MMKKLFFLPLLFITLPSVGQTRYNLEKMKMESLDRGVVAVRMSKDSVLVSWRYLSQQEWQEDSPCPRRAKHLFYGLQPFSCEGEVRGGAFFEEGQGWQHFP